MAAPAMPHAEQDNKHIELQQQNAEVAEKDQTQEAGAASDAAEAKPPATAEALAPATTEATAHVAPEKPAETLEHVMAAPAMPHAEQDNKHIELQQQNAEVAEKDQTQEAGAASDAAEAKPPATAEALAPATTEATAHAEVTEKDQTQEAGAASDTTEATPPTTAEALAPATTEATAHVAPETEKTPPHKGFSAASQRKQQQPTEEARASAEVAPGKSNILPQQPKAVKQEPLDTKPDAEESGRNSLNLPQQLANVKEELLEETYASKPQNLYVLKLAPSMIKDILGMGFNATKEKRGKVSAMLTWQSKTDPGTSICAVETGQQGSVAFLATLVEVRPITTFGELRSSRVWSSASGMQRQAWRNRVIESKKPLYEWIFDNFLVPCESMQVPCIGARSYWIEGKHLQRSKTRDFPEMNLRSTAGYFVRRLCSSDWKRLEAKMKSLDSKTITYGSTCSGTDICVASCGLHLLSCAQSLARLSRNILYICIYISLSIYIYLIYIFSIYIYIYYLVNTYMYI